MDEDIKTYFQEFIYLFIYLLTTYIAEFQKISKHFNYILYILHLYKNQ